MNRVYPIKHGGCAIICGAAPSLFEDLKRAQELRPQADILGVKYAAALVPEIQHVWTQHAEFTLKIKASAGRQIFVHSREPEAQSDKGTVRHITGLRAAFDAVDYVWPSLSFVTGSSGVAGALWAKHGMCYNEVIMVGITLSVKDATYASGYPNKYQKVTKYASDEQIDNWLKILKEHQKNGLTNGIYSMRGATRKVLGEPC